MSHLSKFGILAFGLAVVVGVSACQKKQEPAQTSATDTTQTSAESPFPVEETPPAANTTPPATPPATSSGTRETRAHETRTTERATRHTARSTGGEHATVNVPAGTSMDLAMVTDQSTKTSNVGDPIEAKLAAPLVIGDKVVAEEGAHVKGTIVDLKRASSGKERASMKFNFTTLETVGGDKTINATVTNSEGKELQAEGTGTRDKLLIGGGTVAGAIIGKVAGKSTKSTIIGALGGAAVGAGVVMAAKGHELEVPAGAKVQLRIEDPVTVVMAK
jgi:hypothetical protein